MTNAIINKNSDRITYDNANAFSFLEMTERAMDAETKSARLESEMKNKDEQARQFAKDAFAHTSELMAEIAKLKAEIESLKG